MKTIQQALVDELIYPVPEGNIENKLIARGLNGEQEYTKEVSKQSEFKGAMADCYVSLIQSVSFSEADKSVSALTDEMKKKILFIANKLYESIGEPPVETGDEPMVYMNC